MENPIILQPQVTLDEALLGGMTTFRNGCNFGLKTETDGSRWLEWGCYGVHVNLATGMEYLLMKWLGVGSEEPKRLDGLVSPATISELLKRSPCGVCGRPYFAAPGADIGRDA